MIEVELTREMKKRAWDRAARLGVLKNSITAGGGNIVGCLGEEAVKTLFPVKFSFQKDYDFIYKDIRYDIKTKKCKSRPLDYYECSVAAYNVVQKCDRYIFVRVEWKYNKWCRAYILGWYEKEKYFQHANKLFKGQRHGDNWFKVKANCYNLPIHKLNDMTIS